MIGVYQILCVKTGKRYIGSSCDIQKRWRGHCQKLNSNKHDNIHLQRAWNKYGQEAFRLCLLEKCEEGQEKIKEQSKNISFNFRNLIFLNIFIFLAMYLLLFATQMLENLIGVYKCQSRVGELCNKDGTGWLILYNMCY